jgi:hypothetical protein
LLSKWQADHIRVSLFSGNGTTWGKNPAQILQEAFSLQAGSSATDSGTGQLSANAIWDGAQLTVACVLNRLDIFLRPILPNDGVPLPHPLGNIEGRLNALKDIINNIALSSERTIMRLAIGCVALLPKTSVEEGYLTLKTMLPMVAIDTDRFKNLVFQVNLPKKSECIDTLDVNNLSTWSVATVHTINIALPSINREAIYTSCNVDINTDGANTMPIDKAKFSKLFVEMEGAIFKLLNSGLE